MATYRIVRFYQRKAREVVKEGMTLPEAQEHCADPETASDTCTSEEGMRRTSEEGPWFDGYEREE